MTGRAVSALALCTLLLLLLLLLLGAGLVAAAAPSAAPIALVGGDPRSEGSGPGIVGSPLMILLAVVGLGVATALVTIVVARLAQRH